MSSQAAIIRRSIIELLQGSIGSVRRLPLQVFCFGVFDGQPTTAQQTRAADPNYLHQFDVTVGGSKPHSATPQSNKANYRIETRAITVRVVTSLSITSDELTRLEQRERVEQNCCDAIGVLSYPGNLLATSNGELTRIVSGMLCGDDNASGVPRYEVVSEDWKRALHVSRIVGVAIVNVPQTVAVQ